MLNWFMDDVHVNAIRTRKEPELLLFEPGSISQQCMIY